MRFGWFRGWLKKAISNKKAIYTLEDLRSAIGGGIASSRQNNPEVNNAEVSIVQAGPFPAQISKLMVDAFHIKRTYCVSSRKAAGRQLNVEIVRHIYSNQPTSMLLMIFIFSLVSRSMTIGGEGSMARAGAVGTQIPCQRVCTRTMSSHAVMQHSLLIYPRRANAGMGRQCFQSRSLGWSRA